MVVAVARELVVQVQRRDLKLDAIVRQRRCGAAVGIAPVAQYQDDGLAGSVMEESGQRGERHLGTSGHRRHQMAETLGIDEAEVTPVLTQPALPVGRADTGVEDGEREQPGARAPRRTE